MKSSSLQVIIFSFLFSIMPVILWFWDVGHVQGEQVIFLTFDRAVDMAMGESYRIRELKLGIERSRYYLKAERAGLKSRVYMELETPEFDAVSDYKWNSTLRRNEIVRQNTRLWEMNLSVEQPVILLGYPTNGFLSLNNRLYRYNQIGDTDKSVNYYNRHFIRFEQPFFLPNELKNDIEEAKLDLEEEELEYIDDRIDLIYVIADDYYDLFELTYTATIYQQHIEYLEEVMVVAEERAMNDSLESVDTVKTEISISNLYAKSQENASDMRLESAELKQQLDIEEDDSLAVNVDVVIKPVEINLDEALDYGYTLHPQMRLQAIEMRKDEIDLENTIGRDKFHVNLEMTYGLEKKDERYQEMWDHYNNSYSVSVNAYVPIWDWGRQKARVQAERISLKENELETEQRKERIKSEITNTVANFNEYKSRVLRFNESIEKVEGMYETSLEQYRKSQITIQDLLQVLSMWEETEFNFLDAYSGYRRSLLALMVQTHYDFEKDISLIDKYEDIDPKKQKSLNLNGMN